MTEEEQFVTTCRRHWDCISRSTYTDTVTFVRALKEVDIQPPTKINSEIPRVQTKLAYNSQVNDSLFTGKKAALKFSNNQEKLRLYSL